MKKSDKNMIISVYYIGRKYRTNAIGEYNIKTGELVVKKKSIVSDHIADFRDSMKIKNMREKYVDKNGVVMMDLIFRSASSAAEFVSGFSVNGLLCWHVDKHVTLKDYLMMGTN